MTILDRFASKIDRNHSSGCHVWTAAKNSGGYGRFGIGGKNKHAHRVAWELSRGPVPDGLCVCHRCDNPACVNLAHLFLGTISDNNKDMAAKGRASRLLGPRNPKTKLTADQVLEIRKSDKTNTELGRIYGVDRVSIRAIRLRESWGHI